MESRLAWTLPQFGELLGFTSGWVARRLVWVEDDRVMGRQGVIRLPGGFEVRVYKDPSGHSIVYRHQFNLAMEQGPVWPSTTGEMGTAEDLEEP